MLKFVQFNQTKRHIAQKLYSFLCNFTCYKSVTEILQNGYKWLQTCNHTGFTKVTDTVSIVYTGRTGIYMHVKELQMSYVWKGAAQRSYAGAVLRSYTGAAFRTIFGAALGSYKCRCKINITKEYI